MNNLSKRKTIKEKDNDVHRPPAIDALKMSSLPADHNNDSIQLREDSE